MSLRAKRLLSGLVAWGACGVSQPASLWAQAPGGGIESTPPHAAPVVPLRGVLLDAKSDMERRARAWEASCERVQKSPDDAAFLKGLAQLARDVWRDLAWDVELLHSGARRFLPDAAQARVDELLARHLLITGAWHTAALRADPKRRFVLRDRAVVFAARALLRGDVAMAREAQQHFAWGDGPEASEDERVRMKLVPDLVPISLRAAGPTATRWLSAPPPQPAR